MQNLYILNFPTIEVSELNVKYGQIKYNKSKNTTTTEYVMNCLSHSFVRYK